MITNEQTIMLISIMKLERDLSKNMKDMGHDVQVRLTDFTRQMSSEAREAVFKLIDEQK